MKVISKRIGRCLVILFVVFPVSIMALSAQQVYQKVKDSVYILYSVDRFGNAKARGSAVSVQSNILATNCHLALASDYVVVKYHDGSLAQATHIYKDEKEDLCLLEIAGAHFPSAKMRFSFDIKIGEEVYAVGNPTGTERTLSRGVISNKHKVKDGVWLQTDAALYFGSSGGGLFDDKGRLIGLTTKMGGNFGFAIPTEWIVQVLKEKHQAHLKEIKVSDTKDISSVLKAGKIQTQGLVNKALIGLEYYGSYGRDHIRLYRNNKECFLLIRGRNVTGFSHSALLWNPKYPKTLIIFPTANNARKAMDIVYHAMIDNRTGKQIPYRSEDVLYIGSHAYSLYGSRAESGKKYAFFVSEFNTSLRSAFLSAYPIKVVCHHLDGSSTNETIIYPVAGIAEGLSAYSSKCAMN